MAAILPFLEDETTERAIASEGSEQISGLGKAAARDLTHEIVETNHASLTRFVWNRALVVAYLRQCRYWIELDRGEYVFKIDNPLPKNVRPWKVLTGDKTDRFRFFGDGNAKMACPTWDLPAGPPATGGSCPGAAAAQTVLPPEHRRQHLTPDLTQLRVPAPGGERVRFKEAHTICNACYANEGNFDYGEIQAATLLRYWWTKELLRTPAGREEWVQIMTASVLAMSIPFAEDCYSQEQVKPIRIHSSGDFFSPAYAQAWVEVANRVGDRDPAIKFWCPTRSWVMPGAKGGAAFDWPGILGALKRPNFVVRASAYHVGDNAPEGLTEKGKNGWARGTTSLVAPIYTSKKTGGDVSGKFQKAFPDAITSGDDDPRTDHDCPVYGLKKENEEGSCETAKCRVCWTRPDVRVSYALH